MRRHLVLLAALAMLVVPATAQAHQPRGNSTAYCLVGRGGWVFNAQAAARLAGHLGIVAVPRPSRVGYFARGTIVSVSDGPFGAGTYVVGDRIGWGSQLDFAIPGDCAAARQWGRRTVSVAAVEGMPQ